MPKKIMVIGLGLIGGSLALAIKKEHPEVIIYGWDMNEKSQQIAVEKGIIDEGCQDWSDSAGEMDVIILAVPVRACVEKIHQLAYLTLKKDVIITDASSTKEEVMKAADSLSYTFIGGHPMAGSHKSGVQAANVDLFENAYYIFAVSPEKERELAELQDLLKGTRAKFIQLDPHEHDQITGMLSHLPHIIAAGLVNQSDVFSRVHPGANQMAAGGFRDITRIASSDPRMWTDILLSNRETLLDEISDWQALMIQVTHWLAISDEEAIYQFFENARDTRESLPVHENGAIPAFYDLFIDVPDVPGVIAEVTAVLGEAGISIINLKIQETREDINGVLQVSFKTKKDLELAARCIEEKTSYAFTMK